MSERRLLIEKSRYLQEQLKQSNPNTFYFVNVKRNGDFELGVIDSQSNDKRVSAIMSDGKKKSFVNSGFAFYYDHNLGINGPVILLKGGDGTASESILIKSLYNRYFTYNYIGNVTVYEIFKYMSQR